MEKKDDTREALEARIEAAFASRLRPADDDLALRNEDFASYEGNQAAAYFAARAVPEVSYASMIETLGPEPGECFAFLQAEGLCFFLPAFLRIALDVEGTGDFSDRLVFAVARPGVHSVPELSERFQRLIDLLAPNEKRALRDALEWIARESGRLGDPESDALLALESYWREAAP